MAVLKINNFFSFICNGSMLGWVATLYFCHYSFR